MARRSVELTRLRAGYDWRVRAVEYLGLTGYAVTLGALGARLWPHLLARPWIALAALSLGFLGADFVSGFVHWAADTWGSVEMRWIGQALIRPFREHHIDPKEITRHDFVETNGNNCLISIPPILFAHCLPFERGAGLLAAASIGSLVIWVMLTNQFHKWAHLDAPPRAIGWLQRWHLILPPAHHALHHQAPHTEYFCITAGWLNAPLKAIRFFPRLERAVQALTGLVPRGDTSCSAPSRSA